MPWCPRVSTCEAGVVDAVENCDLEPGEGSPRHDLPSLGVVQEVPGQDDFMDKYLGGVGLR